MKPPRPRADDWLDEGVWLGSGSASTLNPLRDWKPPVREFAPGFHGANPGPSHDDTPKPRVRKRKTPT